MAGDLEVWCPRGVWWVMAGADCEADTDGAGELKDECEFSSGPAEELEASSSVPREWFRRRRAKAAADLDRRWLLWVEQLVDGQPFGEVKRRRGYSGRWEAQRSRRIRREFPMGLRAGSSPGMGT